MAMWIINTFNRWVGEKTLSTVLAQNPLHAVYFLELFCTNVFLAAWLGIPLNIRKWYSP